MSLDTLGRQALWRELDGHQGWNADVLARVFHVLREATDGVVGARDIALIDHVVLDQLFDSSSSTISGGNSNNQSQTLKTVGDTMKATRCALFILHYGEVVMGVAAYIREWKHWVVCSANQALEDGMKARFCFIASQLNRLNLVPLYNHGIQFFCPGQSNTGTKVNGIYTTFYCYVLLRSIKHFDIRDDFATHLAMELVVLGENNRDEFVRHLRAIVDPFSL